MEKIPLPNKIEVKDQKDNRKIFIFEPFYPGYGTTIGNAIRRVLLSSLPGAAIQSVKIKGVEHEFSTIPYVKEDVVSIILNLKNLRFKLHQEGPVTLTLKAKGEKTVTGDDVKTTSDVELINKKQPILTLTDKNASIDMELIIGHGRGYIPVENREKEKLEIGTIALDAIYTPIKNVNFEIENVRVEQMTNYDRLILDITTDGTITPDEALKMSTDILVEQFEAIKNMRKGPKSEEKGEVKAESTAAEGDKPAKKKRGRPKKTETQ